VQTDALALSALRIRYLHPYDEYSRGGPGTYVLDVTISRIDRNADGFHVVTQGTSWDGLSSTSTTTQRLFQTPLGDRRSSARDGQRRASRR
jgi:hypothetical protein